MGRRHLLRIGSVLAHDRHLQGVTVSFWDYARVGVPVTLLTLALGIAWLQFVPY
jgi:Na+/H+ antiporter NhaD/arsenite permease-like protein